MPGNHLDPQVCPETGHYGPVSDRKGKNMNGQFIVIGAHSADSRLSLDDRFAVADWLAAMANWDVYQTLTWRLEYSADACKRSYEKFMRKYYYGRKFFYSLEKFRMGRGGWHVHAMMAGSLDLYRKEMHAKWSKKYGNSRIVPIEQVGGCVGYVAKYVTKQLWSDGWWDFELYADKGQLDGASFHLVSGHSVASAFARPSAAESSAMRIQEGVSNDGVNGLQTVIRETFTTL